MDSTPAWPGKICPGLVAILVCLAPYCFADGAGSDELLDAWTITHFEQAPESQKLSQYRKAAEEYRLILSRRPGFAEAWLNLGIVYQEQN
jgi:tetratricopeptide (TPR) repeat protein